MSTTERPPTDSILRLTQELVRIPSRGGLDRYEPVIAQVRSWLAAHGVSSEELKDGQGGAVGVRARVGSEGGSCYVLNATLDTASYGDEALWTRPPLSGEQHEGWLYGRGSADSKCAVAIFSHLATRLREEHASGAPALELVFDADEHTGHFGGMRAWLARKPGHVRGIFIGYPGDERILIGSRGFWRAQLRVYGAGGHSGSHRTRGVNAVSKASVLVRELEAATMPSQPRGDFPLPPVLTVTGLRGGGDYSLIPGLATVEVDVRLTPTFGRDAAESLVRAALLRADQAFTSSHPTELEAHPGWPAYSIPAQHPMVQALQGAATRVRGFSPPLDVAGPSNTGNLLATQGIPATCGHGVRARNVHAPDEAIDVSSIGPTYLTYLFALQQLLGVSHEA